MKGRVLVGVRGGALNGTQFVELDPEGRIPFQSRSTQNLQRALGDLTKRKTRSSQRLSSLRGWVGYSGPRSGEHT